jgi:hypothetical protein
MIRHQYMEILQKLRIVDMILEEQRIAGYSDSYRPSFSDSEPHQHSPSQMHPRRRGFPPASHLSSVRGGVGTVNNNNNKSSGLGSGPTHPHTGAAPTHRRRTHTRAGPKSVVLPQNRPRPLFRVAGVRECTHRTTVSSARRRTVDHNHASVMQCRK